MDPLNTEYTPSTPSGSYETDSLFQNGADDSLSDEVLVADGVRYRRFYNEDASEL